jgi:uncharacterized protein (TIGR02453 family)
MSIYTLPKKSLDFLRELSENNQRDWFTANKDRYETARESVIEFADALLAAMNRHDQIETPSGKSSLFRIYRDVRFSKNKAPYKNNWAGGLKRATARLRGGYYWHLQPGASFVAGGFWAPSKEDLLRIRQEIATDASELRTIINSGEFKEHFGELAGDKLKTAPKGFDKEHPDIDLLRYKNYVVRHSFTDEEVLAPDFHLKADATFRAMRPFFDFMSETLTTDANGVSLV